MSSPPKVSVITVVKNGATTIQQCIDSVNSQSLRSEHLIIDGLSTDGTVSIARKNQDRVSTIISEEDEGIYSAMNKGLELASGEIVGFLNADDIYEDHLVLERVASIFENHRSEACYGDLVYVDRADISRVSRRWVAGDYKPSSFYWGWMPPHPTFFVLRSTYNRLGCFRQDMGTAADYELMLRFLLIHKIPCSYINSTLVRMREGGMSNSSIRNRIRANLKDRDAWRVNSVKPRIWTLFLKPIRKIVQWF